MNVSVLLTGVGGQGILLAAKIIALAAKEAGWSVCSNETHGMAQRGGSVRAQIKFGDAAHSPLIMEGGADVLAALEHIEALRCAHYLKRGGLAVVSAQSLVPVTVSSGAAEYPGDVPERLARVFPRLVYRDYAADAAGLGDARLANTIMVGVLSAEIKQIPYETWRRAVELSVKKDFAERNLAAFDFGRGL